LPPAPLSPEAGSNTPIFTTLLSEAVGEELADPPHAAVLNNKAPQSKTDNNFFMNTILLKNVFILSTSV